MEESREWSWVDKDGIEHAAVEDELTFALSSEELPPYILVCKRGWGSWLPAMQVAELAWALPPGSADAPHKPRLSSGGDRSPPPVLDYPELEARAAGIKSGVIDPTLAPRASLVPVAAVAAPPAPAAGRQVLETIADEDLEELTIQIQADELAAAGGELEALAAAVVGRDSATPVLPVAAPRSSEHRREIELIAQASHPDEKEYSGAPTPGPTPTPAPVGHYPALEPRVIVQEAKSPRPALRWSVLATVIVGAAGVWWFTRADSNAGPGASATGAATAPAAATTNGLAMTCKVIAGPARLGEWAQPNLKPTLRAYPTPNGDRLAVAYGKTSRYAVGISLNPENLAAEELFSNYESSPLASVSPILHDGKLTFQESRAASTLQSQVAIDAAPPFTFGLGQTGFAVRHYGAAVDTTLWPSTWENISIPSAAEIPGVGFAVAFRAGGERGQIQVASLSQRGEPLVAPQDVKNSATLVGLPSLSSGQGQLMLTFAARPRSRPDSLFVAVSQAPALPTEARPVLSSEAECTSPSLAALPNKDLVLQWTTGTPGNQRVVAQAYDRKLAPVGPELSVSPSAKDAHSGVVTVVGSQIVSIYMVRNGENHELWGTTFSCH